MGTLHHQPDKVTILGSFVVIPHDFSQAQPKQWLSQVFSEESAHTVEGPMWSAKQDTIDLYKG